MNAVVIYGSCYGSTQAYAEYIAQELSCPAVSAKEVTRADVEGRELIVFGGGAYAGSIAGAKKAAKLEKYFGRARLFCFVCGLADPAKQKTQGEARMLFEKAFPRHAGMPACRGKAFSNSMRASPCVFCLAGSASPHTKQNSRARPKYFSSFAAFLAPAMLPA